MVTPLRPNTDAPASAGASAFPYMFRWDRKGRKGQRCKMITRGNVMNSCLLEFEDGFQMVTSRNAIVRAPDAKNSVSVTRKEAGNSARAGSTRTVLPKYPSLTDEDVSITPLK